VTKILLLGPAREAAGVRRDVIEASTVGEVLDEAIERYGSDFAEILSTSQIWVNGDPADSRTVVGPGDEVAVLPPISGG
jgi:molybdopterin synthase sulfur carrier subunit